MSDPAGETTPSSKGDGACMALLPLMMVVVAGPVSGWSCCAGNTHTQARVIILVIPVQPDPPERAGDAPWPSVVRRRRRRRRHSLQHCFTNAFDSAMTQRWRRRFKCKMNAVARSRFISFAFHSVVVRERELFYCSDAGSRRRPPPPPQPRAAKLSLLPFLTRPRWLITMSRSQWRMIALHGGACSLWPMWRDQYYSTLIHVDI